ncbi:MAG TPA: BadF/BadG/BcrA/BcrD ATPase family protein, partial [Gemmatimonadaceae bacterium]
MSCVVGIDLGSTTTKAVILGGNGEVLGRGITNSRSNYDLAAAVARTEAFINARFGLIEQKMEASETAEAVAILRRAFVMEQLLHQLRRLEQLLLEEVEKSAPRELKKPFRAAIEEICSRITAEEEAYFRQPPVLRSDFFRDAVGSAFMRIAEQIGDPTGVSFDRLIGVYDKCIIRVENEPMDLDFRDHIGDALTRVSNPRLADAVEFAVAYDLTPAATVGTGYGRARLPFPKEQIRSEILCHGLGAHAMFPATRTVLDIGGQDTKAIQVDSAGIVTGFQMNDRCAAGCGRYLGYIADEMNL